MITKNPNSPPSPTTINPFNKSIAKRSTSAQAGLAKDSTSLPLLSTPPTSKKVMHLITSRRKSDRQNN